MAYGYNQDCDVISQIHIHQAIEKALKDQDICERKSMKSKQREETIKAANFVKAERLRLRKTLNAVRIACHGYKSDRKTKNCSQEFKRFKPNSESKRSRIMHACERMTSVESNFNSNLKRSHLQDPLFQHQHSFKSNAGDNLPQFSENRKFRFPIIDQDCKKAIENKSLKSSNLEFGNNQLKDTSRVISTTKSSSLPSISNLANTTKTKSHQRSNAFNEFHPIVPFRLGMPSPSLKSHSDLISMKLSKKYQRHFTIPKPNNSAPSTCYQQLNEPMSLQKPLLPLHFPDSKSHLNTRSNVFSKTLLLRYGTNLLLKLIQWSVHLVERSR